MKKLIFLFLIFTIPLLAQIKRAPLWESKSPTRIGTINLTDTLLSPRMITPTLGVASGTSLALGGATIGTNALAVNGVTTLADLNVIHESTAFNINYTQYRTSSATIKYYMNKAYGSIASPASIGNNSGIVEITGTGYWQPDALFYAATQIRMDIDGNVGSGDMPGKITFATSPDGSASLVDRWTTDNTGKTNFIYAVYTESDSVVTTINCYNGNVFYADTLSANTTFTLTNLSDGQQIIVEVRNNSTWTVTWAGYTFVWENGITPVQTTTAGVPALVTDMWSFIRRGNKVYGSVKQNYY